MQRELSERLASSGFVHRATHRRDGKIVYRLADKSGAVLVPARKWEALLEAFDTRLAPMRRRTRWRFVMLPPGIFLFGMTIAQLLPFAGIMILLALFGGPLVIAHAHGRQVKAVSREIEEELARFERIGTPVEESSRTMRAVEIAVMVLAGPHLLISIVGELGGPDFFRNTPLKGSGIGPLEIAIFALVAVWLVFVWRKRLAR